MIKDYLEIGQIVGTHGVRGELRVQPWCDSPEFFKKFKTLYYDAHGEKSVGVVCARPHGNIALLRLDGCDTVEKAASLRGKVLYMRCSDAHLKKGDWFIAAAPRTQTAEKSTEPLPMSARPAQTMSGT